MSPSPESTRPSPESTRPSPGSTRPSPGSTRPSSKNKESLLLLLIITYLTRVNPSAEAVINGCPGQIKNEQLKEKITITDQVSEKCKNYVQCRWIKTKNKLYNYVN